MCKLILGLLRDLWESRPPSPVKRREEKSKFVRRREKRLTYIRNKECYYCARGVPLVHTQFSTDEILDSITKESCNAIPAREHLEVIETSETDDLGCVTRGTHEVRSFCNADWLFDNPELLHHRYPDLKSRRRHA